MFHIKITQPGFEGYTGDLGSTPFVDGVSVEPLTRRQMDHIAALLSVVIVDEDEEEIQAGVTARLVGGATIRAEVATPLARQTEAEKASELATVKKVAGVAPSTRVYKLEELETIASKDGIAGLRPIGRQWGVKGRAIPDLIEAILREQAEFAKNNGERLVTEQTRSEPAAPVIPGVEKPTADETAVEESKSEGETQSVEQVAEITGVDPQIVTEVAQELQGEPKVDEAKTEDPAEEKTEEPAETETSEEKA